MQLSQTCHQAALNVRMRHFIPLPLTIETLSTQVRRRAVPESSHTIDTFSMAHHEGLAEGAAGHHRLLQSRPQVPSISCLHLRLWHRLLTRSRRLRHTCMVPLLFSDTSMNHFPLGLNRFHTSRATFQQPPIWQSCNN